MESSELRPLVAPCPVDEAVVETAQRNGCGDRPGRHLGDVLLPGYLKVVERSVDPELEPVHPGPPAQGLRPLRGFVAIGDGGIADALADRLQGQDAEALDAVVGDQGLVARDVTEIFDDHARIMDRMAVIGDEHRNLGDRREGGELLIGFGRNSLGGDKLDFVADARLVRSHQAHANERRNNVTVNFHETWTPGMRFAMELYPIAEEPC